MKTVVFDVDDTLYDQIEPFKQAIDVAFTLTSLEKKEIPLKNLYKKFRFFSDLAFPQTVDGSLSLAEMRVYRITEALKSFDYQITLEEALKFQKNYHYFQGKIILLDEMSVLLKDLNERNIQLAILTNGPTDHQKAKINQLRVEVFIPETHRFISEEVGIAKPDVAVFKHIEASLKVPAQDLIYIGDSHENDVVGAKNAGWQCIWLNKNNSELTENDIKPDIELLNIKELSQELNKLLSE